MSDYSFETQYTSETVSKRLCDAGFKEENWITRGQDGVWRFYCGTLLTWLLDRSWDISIGKPHDKVLIDAASMKLQKRFAVEADTLPDALGEVILAVLAKEAGHGK